MIEKSVTDSGCEPLVRDELISIEMHAHHVYLVFQHTVVQIGADFTLERLGKIVGRVHPSTRQGDTRLLWEMVKHKIVKAVIGESVQIEFDNGIKIVIPPSLNSIRGTIMGRQQLTYEDF